MIFIAGIKEYKDDTSNWLTTPTENTIFKNKFSIDELKEIVNNKIYKENPSKLIKYINEIKRLFIILGIVFVKCFFNNLFSVNKQFFSLQSIW